MICPKCGRDGTLDSLTMRKFGVTLWFIDHDDKPFTCTFGKVKPCL